MGFNKDAVDRVFEVILSDDRRKLTQDEETSQKSWWRRAFERTTDRELEGAVETWLRENPRGRPNVGEIQKIIQRQAASLNPLKVQQTERDKRRAADLRWAVGVLEAPDRYREEPYKHTLELAEHILQLQGFPSWQDAKAHLEPGWAPPSVNEAYL